LLIKELYFRQADIPKTLEDGSIDLNDPATLKIYKNVQKQIRQRQDTFLQGKHSYLS
jgi:hypothetical protein